MPPGISTRCDKFVLLRGSSKPPQYDAACASAAVAALPWAACLHGLCAMGMFGYGGIFAEDELYHIPAGLCDEIARAAGSLVALKKHATESILRERDVAQTSEAAGPGHHEEQARLHDNFGGDSK